MLKLCDVQQNYWPFLNNDDDDDGMGFLCRGTEWFGKGKSPDSNHGGAQLIPFDCTILAFSFFFSSCHYSAK